MTWRIPPIVKSPIPVVISRLVVVLSERVPVPVMSKTVEFPARTREVELKVETPVPVLKVPEEAD